MAHADENSFGDDVLSTCTDNGDNSGLNSNANVELSRGENNLVFRSRLVFFTLLALIATVMGRLTYKHSQRVEDKDFETRVRNPLPYRVCVGLRLGNESNRESNSVAVQ